MSSEGINPYSPPTTDPEYRTEEHPWYVAMRGVYVRDGAVLPEIDLLTADEGSGLITVERTVWQPRRSGMNPIAFLPIPIFIILVLSGAAPEVGGALAGIFGIAALCFPRLFRDKLRFTMSKMPDDETRRKFRRAFWYTVHGIILLALILIALRFRGEDWSFLTMMGLLLLSTLIQRAQNRGLGESLEIRPASGDEGWVRIGRVHPEAIRKLENLEKSMGWVSSRPVPVPESLRRPIPK